LFPIPGRHKARCGGWDTLCQDLKGIVLSKLSLRELSRAAPTCREFQQALHSRVEEEQAKLIAVGRDTYGSGLFSVFVAGLQRTLRGAHPWPRLVSTNVGIGKTIAITTAGVFACVPAEDSREWLSPVKSWAHVDNRSDTNNLLYGTLHFAEPGTATQCCIRTSFDMKTFGKHNLRLVVWVAREGAVAALGILRAMCQRPRALRACREKPLTTVCVVSGLSRGVAGLREAEDLFAPLSSLAESIAISWGFNGSGAGNLPIEVQSRPLGVLIVVLL
jgi:hypothetical protein